MTITITVPNNDHVALRAMAKALDEIAIARGAPRVTNIDTANATASLEKLRKYNSEVDTTSQQVESLHASDQHPSNQYDESHTIEESPDNDSSGIPWDERIHSTNKVLNSDGTWRLRRKPADKTPEEWTAYVKWVEEDLIVSVASASPDTEPYDVPQENFVTITGFADEPSVTAAGDDFHVDAGEVTEQEVASIPMPPLPVPPALPVFATVQEVDELLGLEPAMTFPQVMQFLTERHGRITSAQVDQVIADMGLNSIMDLNTQPEHTGPFIARVKALLGE